MKKIYSEQWRVFKESYWKLFVGVFLLFIVSSVGVFFFLKSNSELVETLMKEVLSAFEDSELLDPNMSGWQLALGLFWNNASVCLLLVATGFIPIFLPAIGIVTVNGGVIGVLFAYISILGQSVAATFFAGILPHGIFEIPAIILAGSLAIYLSVGIFKKIEDNGFSYKQVVGNTAKSFVFLCVPLLMVAALIEAFITPMIIGGFM